MKKTILFLVIVLMFSCPSIQAKMSMRIISRNKRSHEEKTVADNEVKKEVTKTVEVKEAIEAVEAKEVREVTETKEVTEATEAAEVEEVAGTVEAVEAVEAIEAVEAVEAIEVTETKEATETVEVTEAKETIEAVEAREVTEAKMPMRIISRYKRLYEEKVVADNGEKKEATKSAVVEETETSEVIEAADVDEVAGTTDVKEVPVAAEVTETTEAVDAIEAAKVEEVKEAVEVTEAAKVEEAKAAEAIEAIEAREARETKEATEVTEAKEAKVPVEVTEAAKVEEVTESKEIKEPTETGPVDYEALGLRSVELNPNDYPDEVIALLEPHKNSENNDSVLFYSSLGLAYKSKGRLKAAIAAYKRALKLVPNVPAPSIQYNLGIAYYYNNELHKSFSCFLNSSAQRPDHLGTEKWIKQLADELDIYKVPNTSKLKLVVNQKISVNRVKDDRESRLRMYLTQDGGCIQELSVKDKIYSYGIDSDVKRPVDYIIIDNDGDGSFDSVVNNKGKFGVPTWAYNPD